jgi:hypothetical protein
MITALAIGVLNCRRFLLISLKEAKSISAIAGKNPVKRNWE